MAFIYLVTNKINGKQYIGATTATVEIRWLRHTREALNENHEARQALHDAIRKYGPENFEIKTLFEHEDAKFVFNVMESAFIKQYKTHGSEGGYNMTNGGDGWLGMKHTQETKDKIGNINRGRVVSEETRKRMSEANKGRKAWNEGLICPQLGDSKRGVRQSQEQKDASTAGIKALGLRRTDDQKEKIAAKISETHTIQNITTQEIITIDNLRQFCKDHDMSQGNLISQGHTKNFKMIKTIKKLRTYTIQDTNTQETFTTNNLKQFCEARNVSNAGLLGKFKINKPYLNWKILDIAITPTEKIYS